MNLPQNNLKGLFTMSYLNCISKLLDLQEVLVDFDNIIENDIAIIIPISTEKKEQVCPCCGKKTSHIHDYRTQLVKDLSFRRKQIVLKLRKRRYVCPHCGKRFYERYAFLPRYYHFSNRLYANILLDLKSKSSFKDIASNNFVSTNTVSRALKLVGFPDKPALPEVLGIDEFKGNCDNQKYHVQLTDISNKKTLNILICRKKLFLHTYFSDYPRNERLKVKYLVIDMWDDYKSLSVLFPNAKVIVDKFHYVRQVFWALDAVRKRIQKYFIKNKRIRFKRLRYLLYKAYKDLNDEDRLALHDMLQQSIELENSWLLKEQFIDMINSDKPTIKDLTRWIEQAERFEIPEFNKCLQTLAKWQYYIAEGFETNYTNAFTEGKHNLIKVLKRNAFGFRNFSNFRKRILLCS